MSSKISLCYSITGHLGLRNETKLVLSSISIIVLLGFTQVPSAYSETVFDENFDTGINGWTQTLCSLQVPSSQDCSIGTSIEPEPAPSLPNWGFTQVFSLVPSCAGPIEVKHEKTFTVDSEDDYDITSWISTPACSTCVETSTLYVDGAKVFEQSGLTGDNPRPPPTTAFHQSTIHLLTGQHTVEMGSKANFACAGNFRASFDDIKIKKTSMTVGGELIPLDNVSLVLAYGLVNSWWMAPIGIGIGVGIYLVKRKF